MDRVCSKCDKVTIAKPQRTLSVALAIEVFALSVEGKLQSARLTICRIVKQTLAI